MKRSPTFISLAALLLATSAALAVKPLAFSHSAESDYTPGKFNNTVVDSYGTLTLGRALAPIALDAKPDILTAFSQTADGTLVAAAGDKILRLENGKSSPLYTAPKDSPDITAIAPYKESHILAAVSGEGAKLLLIPTKTREAPRTLWQDKSVDTIWAILPAPDGSFYLGTGPNGTIYKLTADGTAEKILETKSANFISLAFDKPGNLIAGTDASHGSGLVIRIDKATNKPFVLLDTGDSDVSALTTDSAGNIFVATASTNIAASHNSPDNLDKSDPTLKSKSKPSATEPDSPPEPPEEPPAKKGALINLRDRAILAAGPDETLQKMLDNLHAAGKSSSSTPFNVQTKPKPTHGKNSPSKPSKKPLKPLPDFSDAEETPSSAVYQITPDGLVTKIVSQPDANYALLLTKDELLIGTGMSGKLYAYRPADESLALIARVPQEEISALFAAKDNTIFVGTTNAGAAYTLSPTLAPTGTYTSEVLDAKHSARFGRATLASLTPPNTKATIAFRSGNTKDPAASENFWSPWTDDSASPSPISAPAARYLQYRITLTSDGKDASPSISSTKLIYQVENLPPVIKNLAVDHDTPGVSDPDSPPDRTTDNDDKSPLLHITWEATDPNHDTLSHRIYYRALVNGKPADDTWTPLTKDLSETNFDWDTRSLPDGTYQVKVITTDAPDNPADSARTVARESAPIRIDHTPPQAADLKALVQGNRVTLSGTAKDALSAITDVRFQIDGRGDWQPLAPSDKIFDSPEEAFSGTTRPLAVGSHRIAIRATDEFGNSAYSSATVAIKESK